MSSGDPGASGEFVQNTVANGQPAAATYHHDGGGTYHALGLALLTVTPPGIARITVFAGGPGLVAKSGLPATGSG